MSSENIAAQVIKAEMASLTLIALTVELSLIENSFDNGYLLVDEMGNSASGTWQSDSFSTKTERKRQMLRSKAAIAKRAVF